MKPLRYDARWIKIDGTGVALCAAMTLLLYFGGVRPLMDRHAAARGLQQRLSEHKQQASSLSSSLASTRAQAASARQAIASNPLRLQSAKLVNNRLAEVTELASAGGLRIELIQPGSPRKSDRYEIVPIRVAGGGTFTTCVAFLHTLRHRFPDTGVAGFQLAGNPSLPTSPARFEFDLEWYATPTAPNPPAPVPPPNIAAAQ